MSVFCILKGIIKNVLARDSIVGLGTHLKVERFCLGSVSPSTPEGHSTGVCVCVGGVIAISVPNHWGEVTHPLTLSSYYGNIILEII